MKKMKKEIGHPVSPGPLRKIWAVTVRYCGCTSDLGHNSVYKLGSNRVCDYWAYIGFKVT